MIRYQFKRNALKCLAFLCRRQKVTQETKILFYISHDSVSLESESPKVFRFLVQQTKGNTGNKKSLHKWYIYKQSNIQQNYSSRSFLNVGLYILLCFQHRMWLQNDAIKEGKVSFHSSPPLSYVILTLSTTLQSYQDEKHNKN